MNGLQCTHVTIVERSGGLMSNLSHPQSEHFYHHYWCRFCGTYTVHDCGTCTRCHNNKDTYVAESVPEEPVLPVDVEEGESRNIEK